MKNTKMPLLLVCGLILSLSGFCTVRYVGDDSTRLTIVAFGNSVTATRKTVKAVFAQRLPDLLANKGIRARVINSGIPGSHSGRLSDNNLFKIRHALDRFETDVLAHKPDLVIIGFGINDAAVDKSSPNGASRIPIAEFRANMEYMVAKLQQEGAEVILMAPNIRGGKGANVEASNRRLRNYIKEIYEIARTYKAGLVDNYKLFEGYQQETGTSYDSLMLDGLHPNDAGHQLIANQLANEIERIAVNSSAQAVRNIGSRLELFVDDYLIEHLDGGAQLRLHHPTPKEIVLVHDEPWEGSGSGFYSIFKDGEKYRMYYKAWQHTASKDVSTVHPSYCAYAESMDGINWVKPNLGIFEINGTKDNNVVLVSGKISGFNLHAGLPAVFKDSNPNVPKDEQYKAIIVSVAPGKSNHGLVGYKSPDGIHWTLISEELLAADDAFDGQNIAFWDLLNNEYRAYWRYYSEGTKDSVYRGVRSIKTATSKDFLHWENKMGVSYMNSPEEHLYTNPIEPYYRAPHIYVGFPARYIDRGWSPSMKALPQLEERELRARKNQRYGTALTESLFMASRDRINFKRWNEAFIRPGIERDNTWTYGDGFLSWGMIETASDLAGAPNELSLYASERYWKGKASALRRYTLRLDGFVSVNAPLAGGELLTRQFTFDGNSLNLNFSSSAAGQILVELLDENGKVIPGYALTDCDPIFGDAIKRQVSWGGVTDVSGLSGRIIQMRIELYDADLYSIQFE